MPVISLVLCSLLTHLSNLILCYGPVILNSHQQECCFNSGICVGFFDRQSKILLKNNEIKDTLVEKCMRASEST